MSELAYVLRVYMLPVLIIGGSILNMLSFAVMRRIRSSSTSNYMATLGLVDTGVLVIGGVSLWMYTVDSNSSFPVLSIVTCKLVPFALYTLLDLSVFIIVIMTGERFYAVWRPLQANKRAKKSEFRIAILSSIIVCAAINCHFVFTHSTRKARLIQANVDGVSNLPNITDENVKYEQICIDTYWHTFYDKYWVYIDATIYSFAPSILLTIFNILIIRYLFKAADESLKLKEVQKNSYSNGSETKSFTSLRPVIFHTNYQTLKSSTGRFSSSATNGTLYMGTCYEEPSEQNLKIKHSHSILTQDSCLESMMPNKQSNVLYDYDVIAPNRRISSKSSYSTVNLIPSHSNLNVAQPIKKLNTRITVMLIALNITFCIFSMPMVILQIIYYSFYQFLEATSYYLYMTSSASPVAILTTAITTSQHLRNGTYAQGGAISGKMHSHVSDTVADIPVDEDLLAKIDLIKSIAELLQYLNHSTNFFLYSLSGKTFRNETKAFIWNHLRAIKAFFRKKRFAFLLGGKTVRRQNVMVAGDANYVKVRKDSKLRRQNSFKYSIRTTLI